MTSVCEGFARLWWTCFMATLVVLAVTAPSHGETWTWVGGAMGNWTDAASWSNGTHNGVPGVSDTALVHNDTTLTVIVPAGSGTLRVERLELGVAGNTGAQDITLRVMTGSSLLVDDPGSTEEELDVVGTVTLWADGGTIGAVNVFWHGGGILTARNDGGVVQVSSLLQSDATSGTIVVTGSTGTVSHFGTCFGRSPATELRLPSGWTFPIAMNFIADSPTFFTGTGFVLEGARTLDVNFTIQAPVTFDDGLVLAANGGINAPTALDVCPLTETTSGCRVTIMDSLTLGTDKTLRHFVYFGNAVNVIGPGQLTIQDPRLFNDTFLVTKVAFNGDLSLSSSASIVLDGRLDLLASSASTLPSGVSLVSQTGDTVTFSGSALTIANPVTVVGRWVLLGDVILTGAVTLNHATDAIVGGNRVNMTEVGHITLPESITVVKSTTVENARFTGNTVITATPSTGEILLLAGMLGTEFAGGTVSTPTGSGKLDLLALATDGSAFSSVNFQGDTTINIRTQIAAIILNSNKVTFTEGVVFSRLCSAPEVCGISGVIQGTTASSIVLQSNGTMQAQLQAVIPGPEVVFESTESEARVFEVAFNANLNPDRNFTAALRVIGDGVFTVTSVSSLSLVFNRGVIVQDASTLYMERTFGNTEAVPIVVQDTATLRVGNTFVSGALTTGTLATLHLRIRANPHPNFVGTGTYGGGPLVADFEEGVPWENEKSGLQVMQHENSTGCFGSVTLTGARSDPAFVTCISDGVYICRVPIDDCELPEDNDATALVYSLQLVVVAIISVVVML